MKKTVALLVLCLLFVGMLWQALASDRTVSVNELLTVSLSGDVTKGRVYAALYRDGRMIAVKSYAPEELSTVSFDAMQYGDHIKVLWWDAPMEEAAPATEESVVEYIDYSVGDASPFMVVYEVSEYLNAEDKAQFTICGYNTKENVNDMYIKWVADYAKISDSSGNAMRLDDVCAWDVVSYTTNKENEIVELKVLFTAEEVLSDTPGFSKTYTNEDGQTVKEVYGYVAASSTDETGNTNYQLSQYPFSDDEDIANVEFMDEIISDRLTGSVYYVDFHYREPECTVHDNFKYVCAGNISLDRDGSTKKDGEGYFMYTKIVDGNMVDAVVYIVDCEDFYLDYYSETGATFAYVYDISQEITGKDAVVSMKVMEKDGTWNTYPISETVRVFCDGVLYRAENRADFATHAAVWTQDEIWYDETNKKMRCVLDLLCYKLNADGEIATLIIPTKNEATTGTYGKSFTAVYDAETGMLGDIKITKSTVVYAVKNGIENRQDYIKLSQKVLKDGETYTGEYLVSVGGDKTVPDAIVVEYTDYSVIDTEPFMIVEGVGLAENVEGDAQDVVWGYQLYEDYIWDVFVADGATIIDKDGNSGNLHDICEGDVVAYTLNQDEIVELKVLFTAEEVLSDTPGFSKTYTNEDGQTVKEVYGYVADSSTDETGNTNYKLSQYPFSDDEDIANVEFMDEIISEKLKGMVYYVDLSKKNVYYEVSTSFENVKAGNISLDRDGSMKKDGEGYFMYTKIVDGNIVDVVVYIVDCEDFDLSKYSSTEQVQ